MIQYIKTVMLLLTAVAGASVYAQQNTLGSLWLKVEQNYPGIKAAQSAMAAAVLNEKSVSGNRLPQVKMQIQNSYSTYDGSAGAFYPQPGFFNVSGSAGMLTGAAFSPNTFSSAVLEWDFFSFGKLKKEKEMSHSITNTRILEKDAYLLKLKKSLSERYISLIFQEAKLKWNEKNIDLLNDIRGITSGLSAAGLKPAADSLLALSSYMQALGEADRLGGSRQAALINLSELLNADTSFNKAPLTKITVPPGFLSPQTTLNIAHPMLMLLNEQSAYYELSSAFQKRSSLPSLKLLGGYAFRGSGIDEGGYVSGKFRDGFSNTTNNVLAGLGITWNITDLYTKRIKAGALSKEAERSKLLTEQYLQSMQADLSATAIRIFQQYEQLKKIKTAVEQAGAAYNMYLARYKSGLINLSELLQIRILLEQAENNHIEASKNYWLLLADEAELTADFNFLFNNL